MADGCKLTEETILWIEMCTYKGFGFIEDKNNDEEEGERILRSYQNKRLKKEQATWLILKSSKKMKETFCVHVMYIYKYYVYAHKRSTIEFSVCQETITSIYHLLVTEQLSWKWQSAVTEVFFKCSNMIVIHYKVVC